MTGSLGTTCTEAWQPSLTSQSTANGAGAKGTEAAVSLMVRRQSTRTPHSVAAALRFPHVSESLGLPRADWCTLPLTSWSGSGGPGSLHLYQVPGKCCHCWPENSLRNEMDTKAIRQTAGDSQVGLGCVWDANPHALH